MDENSRKSSKSVRRSRADSSFTTRSIRTRSFTREFHSASDADALEPFIDDDEELKNFVPSVGISQEEAEKLFEKWGPNQLEEKVKPKWKIFIEQFTAPMPIMIWIAIAIEGILENWVDMVILCGLQAVNGGIGYYETTKAGDAVAALKRSLKPEATVKRDGEWKKMDATNLVPGDLISLSHGAAVPADCRINEGTVDVDQAALTGESMPVTMLAGDTPKMGSTVARGETEATVIATGMNTFFGKTANLIQSVDELGHLQKVLLTIMAVLIIISFLLCGGCLWYLLAQGEDFDDAISFVVVILVASIPIAIEVVVTATMALGSRQLTSKGAIVVRLAAIEEMAGMNMLCSDKTGTLTLNKMVIQEDCPLYDKDATSEKVLLYAALAAKWWEPPKDALDTMVLNAVDLTKCEPYTQTDFLPFDPTVKRTESTVKGPDGKTFKVTKGAPHVLLDICHNKKQIEEEVDGKVLELAERGIRSLAVAKTDNRGRWCMQGVLTFLDPPRPDTKRTIELARYYGVDVKMVTGDHQAIAIETSRQLEMGDNILQCDELPTITEGEELENMDELGDMILGCNGFAQVFPEHKFLIIDALQRKGYTCGMTGDGVNDAPALKKADIGIAVADSTEAARAAADIVLTEPGLMTVVDAIITSRMIFARMKSFIYYRIGCTLQIVVFFFVAVVFIHPGEYDPSFPEFWDFPVLALIIITLLNDGTIISIAYDNVEANKNPEVWNLPVVFTIATVLGSIAFASSILLLVLCLNSENSGSFLNSVFGVSLDFNEIEAAMYLQISVTDFLTLFAARSQGFFFASKKPGIVLACAFAFSVTCSTLLSVYWPFGEGMTPISWSVAGVVWLYCLVTFVVQDTIKALVYKLMSKFNILGINNSISIVEAKYREDAAAGAEEQKDDRAEGERILSNLLSKPGTSKKGKTKDNDLTENLISEEV